MSLVETANRRIQIFLIPASSNTSAIVAAVQLALEGEVNRIPGFQPADLVQELAAPPSNEVQRKAAEGRHLLEDGAIQMTDHQYSSAATRYGRAIELLLDAGPVVTPSELAEAYVRRAVALQYSGDDEHAKEAFRAAARIDLARKFDARKVDSELASGLTDAQREIARAEGGSLAISTTPPGSRVFVGGVYRGITPVTVDHLPPGPNWVRIDRAGSETYARLVEVKPHEETTVALKVRFTHETADLQGTMQQLPAALDRDKGIPAAVQTLSSRFRLQRVVIAILSMVREDRAGVRLAVFDLARNARLADEHGVFMTDADSLRIELPKWARSVFDRADGSRNRTAADPLSRSDGTEDWYANKFKPATQTTGAAPPPAQTPDALPPGVEAASPSAEPASPAAEPASPAAEPASPAAEPASPSAEAASDNPAPAPKKASSRKKKSSGDSLESEDGTEGW